MPWSASHRPHFGSDKYVLASRLQIGNIRPYGNAQSNVPFSKRYFLGGATSIRGWGRYEVSPLSDGLPIGGDSMLAWSEEAGVFSFLIRCRAEASGTEPARKPDS